jgi:aryl-alcohol dehydrogenase-like predicted oxidoreductase
MQTRKLGASGLELSVIGLGAWAIGGGDWAYGWGPQDDRDSVDAIRRAIDLGVNWIDTAAAYGLGHSEEIVGKAVKGLRDKVIIATKCGLVWDEKGTIKGSVSAESVRNEVEASLRRLDVEAIDLYQIHWPTREKADLEGWAEIQKMIDEGKIRHAGVSNFNVKQLEALSTIRPPASLQPPYSMLERGVEDELLPYCAANRIGVVAYSPMQCGLLTGKMTRGRVDAMPDDDFRRKNHHFTEPALGATLDMVNGLEEIASSAGRRVAHLAIAWVLRRPEVTSAIVGSRNAAQIEETVGAAGWTLSEKEIDAVETLIQERRRRLRHHRKMQ